MSARPYILISASIFAVVSLLHLVRLVARLSVTVQDTIVPMWPSWGGLVIAGLLATWGYRLARRY